MPTRLGGSGCVKICLTGAHTREPHRNHAEVPERQLWVEKTNVGATQGPYCMTHRTMAQGTQEGLEEGMATAGGIAHELRFPEALMKNTPAKAMGCALQQ